MASQHYQPVPLRSWLWAKRPVLVAEKKQPLTTTNNMKLNQSMPTSERKLSANVTSRNSLGRWERARTAVLVKGQLQPQA